MRAKKASAESIFVLHKYFLHATLTKGLFVQALKKQSESGQKLTDLDPELMTRMRLWYATLYVVVEGWEVLGLQDERVETLLQDRARVELLKRFRNAAFHYQKEYFHEKEAQVYENVGFPNWINELSRAFGRYFLEFLKKRNEKVS